MSQLIWTPGLAGPLEELVKRIHRRIDTFRELHGMDEVGVSVELFDGSLHRLASLLPEPGFGFVTLCPYAEPGEEHELIVPLGAIREIRLGTTEPEQQLGFRVPATE